MTVQVKENDTWTTVGVNGHNTLYNCGNWFHSRVHDDPLFQRGLPIGVEPEKDTFGHTFLTISEFENFIENLEDKINNIYKEYMSSTQFDIINNKLDKLLDPSVELKEPNFSLAEIQIEYKEELSDVECMYGMLFYARSLGELYVDGYISPDNIRIIFSFDW